MMLYLTFYLFHELNNTFALIKYCQSIFQISDLYEDMEYTKILQNTLKFLKDDVSAFYTTLIKDRYVATQVNFLVLRKADAVHI